LAADERDHADQQDRARHLDEHGHPHHAGLARRQPGREVGSAVSGGGGQREQDSDHRPSPPRATRRAGATLALLGASAGPVPPGQRARSPAGPPPWGGTAPASSGPVHTAARYTVRARRNRAAARRTGTGPPPWPAPGSACPAGRSASAGSP